MTKILNFGLKIKGGGREGGTCEVLRPCHSPQKNLKRALTAKLPQSRFCPKLPAAYQFSHRAIKESASPVF